MQAREEARNNSAAPSKTVCLLVHLIWKKRRSSVNPIISPIPKQAKPKYVVGAYLCIHLKHIISLLGAVVFPLTEL